MANFMPIFAQTEVPAAPAPAETTASEGAPAGNPAPSKPPPGMFDMLMIPLLIVAVFYFLIFRPQRKKDKAHKEMLSQVKPGEMVMTGSGIYGEVESVKDDHIILLVDAERGVTLKVHRNAIASIVSGDSKA